jgi:hypothetical protein
LHVAAQDRRIAHELDDRLVALMQARDRGFLQIGVDPERMGVDHRQRALPGLRVIALL